MLEPGRGIEQGRSGENLLGSEVSILLQKKGREKIWDIAAGAEFGGLAGLGVSIYRTSLDTGQSIQEVIRLVKISDYSRISFLNMDLNGQDTVVTMILLGALAGVATGLIFNRQLSRRNYVPTFVVDKRT